MDKLSVKLGDGNAFAILGACSKAMTDAGVYAQEWEQFYGEATSGDYNHLLRTVMERFDVVLEGDDDDENEG
jgi:hypothetical protein